MGAQPAQDRARLFLLHEIDEQAVEGGDAHLRAEIGERFSGQRLALVEGEERLLGRVGSDGEDDFVEELERAANDVDVAESDRVERARIDDPAQVRAHRTLSISAPSLRNFSSMCS